MGKAVVKIEFTFRWFYNFARGFFGGEQVYSQNCYAFMATYALITTSICNFAINGI